MKKGIGGNSPVDSQTILEYLQMTTTIIGIVITALAIEADKLTQYKHYVLPLIALAGTLTVIISLVL
jgi:hypothetical protein